MKYLKNFNDLIKEGIQDEQNSIEVILVNIFRIFKTKDALTEIWDKDSIDRATDVYDSFIDLKELSRLPEDDLQSFADNLGVGSEEDILIAIYKKMYEDKFKRTIDEDIKFCISSLEDFIKSDTSREAIKKMSSLYLTELKKMQDNL